MQVADYEGLCQNLADPLARSALADWLEEDGDHVAAELLRGLPETLHAVEQNRRECADREGPPCCLRIYLLRCGWRWRKPGAYPNDDAAPLPERLIEYLFRKDPSKGQRAIMDSILAILGLDEFLVDRHAHSENHWIDFFLTGQRGWN